MKLTTQTHFYANVNYQWASVCMDGVEIGCCDVRGDGYVMRGSRKVRTLEEVAGVMLRATITHAKKARLDATAKEELAQMQLRALKAK